MTKRYPDIEPIPDTPETIAQSIMQGRPKKERDFEKPAQHKPAQHLDPEEVDNLVYNPLLKGWKNLKLWVLLFCLTAIFMTGNLVDAREIPEFYGVFLRDQGELNKLKSKTLTWPMGSRAHDVQHRVQDVQHKGAPSLEIIVHQRIKTREKADFKRLFLIRNTIYIIPNHPNFPSPSKITDIDKGQLVAFGENLAFNIGPVKGGTPEMIRFVPSTLLQRGIYQLTLETRQIETKQKVFIFSVDVNPKEINYSNIGCVDKIITTKTASRQLIQNPADLLRRNQKIIRYQKCSLLDLDGAKWRSKVEEAMKAGSYIDAAIPASLFAGYNKQTAAPLVHTLSDRLRDQANRAYQLEKWDEVERIAEAFLTLKPDNVIMTSLVNRARISKQKQEVRVLKSRFEISKKPGKVLGKFKAIKYRYKNFKKVRIVGEIHITETGLFGAVSSEHQVNFTGKLQDFAWYCKWAAIKKFNSKDEMFDPLRENIIKAWPRQRRNGPYMARFLHGQKNIYFYTEAEMNNFIRTTKSAANAWYRKYHDLKEVHKCREPSVPK